MTDELPAKHPATIHDGSKPLPYANHEEFALGVVRLNNQAAAWREIFDPAGKLHSRVSWSEAARLAARIDVGVRIDWLRAQSFERSQISVANLMRDLYDIATADPTEITKHVVACCRHCHGAAFKYQWIDAAEFAAECERVAASNARLAAKGLELHPLPSFDGGTGFDNHASPNARCPECMGVGTRHVWVADTTQISDKARKLLTGQVDRQGLPILLDQLAARDQLHKLAGAYKAEVQTMAPTASAQPGDAPSDPAQSYFGMIYGGQARKVG